MMRKAEPRRKPEPTIALINIVFLMLIFFMVAGTLSAPLDSDLKLVQTKDLEGREPPDALVILPDGSLNFRGQQAVSVAGYIASLEDKTTARLVPDQNASALRLVEVAKMLRDAGAQKVMIVTERALQ
jgi:biopolymer transport protein ExbD